MLSLQDTAFVGVASAVGGCDITYGPTSPDSAQDLDGSIRNYSLKMLDGFAFIGCKIETVKFYVQAGSSTIPTGNMYATLYNSSGSVRTTSGAVDMDQLDEALSWIPFTFSGPLTVDEDDFISFTVDYDAAPGAANGWAKCARDNDGPSPTLSELWIGGTDSPDDITQDSAGRQPTMELIST